MVYLLFNIMSSHWFIQYSSFIHIKAEICTFKKPITFKTMYSEKYGLFAMYSLISWRYKPQLLVCRFPVRQVEMYSVSPRLQLDSAFWFYRVIEILVFYYIMQLVVFTVGQPNSRNITCPWSLVQSRCVRAYLYKRYEFTRGFFPVNPLKRETHLNNI
jgi:hypothetical protein